MQRGWNLLLCCFLVPALAAYDEIGLDENNEFGGRTVTFQAPEKGIFRGKDYFDSGSNIMRHDWQFTEESSLASGIQRKVAEFLFDIKTKETTYFTAKYQSLRRVATQIDHFEQATGVLMRREKHFTTESMGYSVTHFQLGKATKLEWFYPENAEGYSQTVTHYGDDGSTVVQEEHFYTPRSQRKEGMVKSEYFSRGEKKLKRIWYYTPEWSAANKGAVKKVVEYPEHPVIEFPPNVNYYDAKGEVVELNLPHTDF